MNKKELIENYTMEQLADMVVEIYEKAEKLDEKHIKAWEMLREHEKKNIEQQSKIDRLEEQLHRKETEIMQIDDILNELFGVTHDIANPGEFKEILREKLKGNADSKGYTEKLEKTGGMYALFSNAAIDLTKDEVIIFLSVLVNELKKRGVDFTYEMTSEPKVYDITFDSSKTLADFLPTEPLEVAGMLISAKESYELNDFQKKIHKIDKAYYHIYDISELRQIADHLLVYCNANGELE